MKQSLRHTIIVAATTIQGCCVSWRQQRFPSWPCQRYAKATAERKRSPTAGPLIGTSIAPRAAPQPKFININVQSHLPGNATRVIFRIQVTLAHRMDQLWEKPGSWQRLHKLVETRVMVEWGYRDSRGQCRAGDRPKGISQPPPPPQQSSICRKSSIAIVLSSRHWRGAGGFIGAERVRHSQSNRRTGNACLLRQP